MSNNLMEATMIIAPVLRGKALKERCKNRRKTITNPQRLIHHLTLPAELSLTTVLEELAATGKLWKKPVETFAAPKATSSWLRLYHSDFSLQIPGMSEPHQQK